MLPESKPLAVERRQSTDPQTIRKYWSAQQGRVSFNYNWPIINHDSVVTITAAQFFIATTPSNEYRTIANAAITVEAVVPHGPPFDPNHGVTFVVNIDSATPVNIATDITVFPSPPIEVDLYTPEMPADIGIGAAFQYQESFQWCWIATATSIAHFYNPLTSWTQCLIMTDVGQKINNFSSSTSACPTPAILAANPTLQATLDDPTNPSALYVLDNPAYGVPTYYLKSGGVDDPLRTVQCFASDQGTAPGLAAITKEINARRPVVVTIQWTGGGQHVITIAGVSGTVVELLDPVSGASAMEFSDFPAGYSGGATVVAYTFTKPMPANL